MDTADDPPGSGLISAPRATAVVLAVVAVGALPSLLVGALAVQIRADVPHGPGQLGVAFSTYFIVSAIGAWAFGRISESADAGRGLRLSAALSIATLVGLAAVTTWWQVVALLAVGGIANGIAQPPASTLIVEQVPVGRRGLAFGLKQAAIPIAALLGGAAVPTIALTVGWRWAFVVAAVAAASVLLGVPTTGTRGAGDAATRRARLSTLRGSYPVLILLGVAAALGGAAANPLGGFATTSGVGFGMSPGAAGTALALGSGIGLVTRVGAGWLGDLRGGRDPLPLVSLMLACGAAGFVLMATGTVPGYVIGLMIAFAGAWAWQGLFGYAVVVRWPAAPAAATGVTQAGLYLGGTAGPLVFGVLSETSGDRLAWGAMATLSIAAVVLLEASRTRTRRGRSGPQA